MQKKQIKFHVITSILNQKCEFSQKEIISV